MSTKSKRFLQEENDLSDAILEGLAEMIEEVTGIEPDEVTRNKNFVNDLDIDSLSMVEIAVQIEDKYGVKTPDADLAGLRYVNDVIQYVLEYIEENPTAARQKAVKSAPHSVVLIDNYLSSLTKGDDVSGQSTSRNDLASSNRIRDFWIGDFSAQLRILEATSLPADGAMMSASYVVEQPKLQADLSWLRRNVRDWFQKDGKYHLSEGVLEQRTPHEGESVLEMTIRVLPKAESFGQDAG